MRRGGASFMTPCAPAVCQACLRHRPRSWLLETALDAGTGGKSSSVHCMRRLLLEMWVLGGASQRRLRTRGTFSSRNRCERIAAGHNSSVPIWLHNICRRASRTRARAVLVATAAAGDERPGQTVTASRVARAVLARTRRRQRSPAPLGRAAAAQRHPAWHPRRAPFRAAAAAAWHAAS